MNQETKYKVGSRVIHTESSEVGVVVENYKLPGDICVEWNCGLSSSYDEEFLDETCTLVT